MLPATPFTDPIAVETWDAAFRWRTPEALRDITIDDTWRRVAQAVARTNGDQAAQWAHRYVDAFSRWRLLPDERLLRFAGTGQPPTELDAPVAVVNLTAFVTAPFGAKPRFDRAAFVETCTLAVRLLDDALLCHGGAAADTGLRIGVVGLGDALRKLGIAYTAPQALEKARQLATALFEGCLRGAIELAEERGACRVDPASAGMPERWATLGMPASLIERGRSTGVRHATLTAIGCHPQLARLANGTSDGLDALALGTAGGVADGTLRAAEDTMRAALQPWIDLPIVAPAAPSALVPASIAVTARADASSAAPANVPTP